MDGKGIPTTAIDLLSDELAADPWPALNALREQGPVVWHQPSRRWLITSDHHVREVLLDYRRFTVEGTVVADLFGPDAFISLDDRRRHNALRAVWSQAFRPTALRDLRSRIAGLVAGLVNPLAERLEDGESVDVTRELCRPLPTLVIALMMGVPEEGLGNVVRWSDAMAGGSTSFLDEADKQAAIDAREAAKAGLADYLLALMRARREAPGGDLISAMVQAEAARGLADEQIVQNVRQLLFAGNETTAKWLAHILVNYAEHPRERKEIAADRRLVRRANEEVLRWQGVVGTLPRRVRGGDVELAGITLRDGDDVTCVLGCANRDPLRYEEPDRFDIQREFKPSLGFGAGLHNCLGANLARLETELAVNALLDRVPDFRLAGEPGYSSVPMRGPVPVVLARA